MIIDRMLPGLDGLSIIAALRAAKNQTPVLVLSALGDVEDRVDGLRAGCDDYLPQAFRLLRTAGAARGADPARRAPRPSCKVGDLEMDLLARTVTRAGSSRSSCCRANSACSNI